MPETNAPSGLDRRQFASLIASPLLPRLATAGAAASSFPFGAHIYREPSLPLEQLREDMGILKRLGFTMVKLQESWSHDEPREGEIRLDKVANLVADARQCGLGVYFGVTMEQAPAWLWREHPDACFVYEDGQKHNEPTDYLMPGDGKPGPCWHHDEARKAAIRFIEAVGRTIGKYDNIQVWNVWQEIGLWPLRAGHTQLCYCASTLREFRKWLQSRYPSVEALNQAWRTGYGDWEDIVPPRSYQPVPAFIDWRYFMDDVYLPFVLKWKADAFRRSDPLARPVMAHVSGPYMGSAQDWSFAKELDLYGSSSYPAWMGIDSWDADAPPPGKPVPRPVARRLELWKHILLRFDYARSASRDGNFWVAELQGGPISSGMWLGRVPSPADIRWWVLGSLAAGARGVCFWNHRPERLWPEGYGFSLLDDSGPSTPRAEEAGRIARGIQKYADLFQNGSAPRALVAILINEDLWHFVEGSGLRGHLAYSLRGIYRALWEHVIPVDFLDVRNLGRLAAHYKTLVMPLPLALDEPLIEALRAWVRQGGTLISEAAPGRFDRYGMGHRGRMAPGVSELFGVTERELRLIREPNDGAKWTGVQRTFDDTVPYRELSGAGEWSSHRVSPAFYLQSLNCTTAKPLLSDEGGVYGAENHFGSGKACLIGTLLGHATQAFNDPRNGNFLAALLSKAGVMPEKIGSLHVRRRVLGKQTAWFLFNITDSEVEESLPVPGGATVSDLLGEPAPRVNGAIKVRVPALDVRCLIQS